MTNKHKCESCIHEAVCEYAVDNYEFICADYIDKKSLENPYGNSTKVLSERPQGEWLHPYKSDIACECSNCHRQMPIANYYHYCPQCGAKMKFEEELNDELRS